MTHPQSIKSDFYTPVLSFNYQNRERIAEICAPLKDCFGLSAVSYLRVLNEGKYLMLSNNEAFLLTPPRYDFFFRTDYFGKQAQLMCKSTPLMEVWADQGDDLCINIYKENGLHNGFNITREKDGYLECMWFCSDDSSSLIRDFYKRGREQLMSFLENFRRLTSDLTDTSDTTRLGTSPYLQSKYPRIADIFTNSTPWERQIESFNNQMAALVLQEIHDTARTHSITMRELECLSYFTAYKSAKEIARIVDASPRTVEKHLENIRLKTRAYNRQELIHWFEDKFRPLLGGINSMVKCNTSND